MQSAKAHDFVVLRVGLLLEIRKHLFPSWSRNLKLASLVIEVGHAGVAVAIDGRLGDSLLQRLLLRHEFRIAAQKDVGAPARHVGGDSDHVLAACLRYDLSFFLVILGVQDDVADIFLFQQLGKPLRFFDGRGTNQYGSAVCIHFLNIVGGGKVFFALGAVDDVRVFEAEHLHIGGDDRDFELVNLVKLGGFRLCGSGHARELLIHAEIILEGDGGKRLVLALDLHAFLGFDGLVQTVGPAPPRHHAPRELVYDDDFAVFHHVLDIATIERVRLDGGLGVVFQVPVLWVGDVADPEHLLDLFPAGLSDSDGLALLVDRVVTGEDLLVQLLNLFATFEPRDDRVHARIFVGGLFAGAADDKRRAGFVDQDGVNFVDDAEIMTALHAFLQIELHVIAQVVETELVVGAVSDIGAVSSAALFVGQVMDDHAYAHSEEVVEAAHPLRVALGQVIVHGDDMHTAAGERIQINRKRSDQRFAFAGLHFGDLAGVQDHAADQLHVEVAHV